MNNDFESFKDFLYESIDYIMILAIILIVGGIIGWRLDLLFAESDGINPTETIEISKESTKPDDSKPIKEDEKPVESKKEVGKEKPKEMDKVVKKEDKKQVASGSKKDIIAEEIERVEKPTPKPKEKVKSKKKEGFFARKKTVKKEKMVENNKAVDDDKAVKKEEVKSKPKTIIIPPGANSSSIGDLLEAEGIVSSSSDFIAKCEDMNMTTKLKYGTFDLSPEYSFEEIIKILIK